jgi:hypothetical protein
MAKRKPRQRKPPPRCKAILLCDHTIVEAVTGKISIIGIFANWYVPHFPIHIRPFTVFLQLTNGIGQYTVSVNVVDLRTDHIIAQAQAFAMNFPERRTIANLLIPVPALLLPHDGSYDFVVLADGQEIDRQQFQAFQVTKGPADARDQPQEPDEH